MDENDINVLLKDIFNISNDYIDDFLMSCGYNFWGQIMIQHPNVTALEKEIDVLIEDIKYALIIENKVMGAQDRPHQLANYINKEKEEGYSNEQIFVIYINDEEPELQSWGQYRKEFEPRYARMSKIELLHWLESLDEEMLKENRLLTRVHEAIKSIKKELGI